MTLEERSIGWPVDTDRAAEESRVGDRSTRKMFGQPLTWTVQCRDFAVPSFHVRHSIFLGLRNLPSDVLVESASTVPANAVHHNSTSINDVQTKGAARRRQIHTADPMMLR